jgi:hypothetical protein
MGGIESRITGRRQTAIASMPQQQTAAKTLLMGLHPLVYNLRATITGSVIHNN